jgi:hypothetical protein
MNELIFKLSELECIKISTEHHVDFAEIDYCCGDAKMYFVNQQQLRICQETVGLIFEAWISRLNKVINSKLFLHESLIQNLGLMWNQKFQKKSNNFFMTSTTDGKSSYWIGLNYEVGGTFNDANPYVTTWLYNDNAGDIILEVTPFYKWSMQEQEPEDPDFISYDEFVKNYKPLIHRVVPRDVAMVWLEQAMKVYRGFFKDEKDFIRACNEMNE